MIESIKSVWESEQSLEAAYNEMLHLSHFDRTKDASKLVSRLMAKVINPHPTYFDVREWVKHNVPDFNIASQILLNQMPGVVRFKTDQLERKVNEWSVEHKEEGPFAKKAKFMTEADPAAEEFNAKLAGIRNLKILKEWVGLNSFRLSPIGATPALADFNNLSSLSINGLKPYVNDDTRIVLLNHSAIAKRINLRQDEDGSFVADGLEFPVFSKSGGDIVTKSLMSRWVTTSLLYDSLTLHVFPKYDSLLVVGDIPEGYEEYLLEFEG